MHNKTQPFYIFQLMHLNEGEEKPILRKIFPKNKLITGSAVARICQGTRQQGFLSTVAPPQEKNKALHGAY